MKRVPAFWILFVVGLLAVSGSLVHLLTEVWWFDAVGFTQVFWTRLGWKVLLWLVTFTLYSLFLWSNYRLAMRLTRQQSFSLLDDYNWGAPALKVANLIAIATIAFLTVSAAIASTTAWETLLKFLNPSDFGLTDPVYNNDIGFYLFKLPFYEAVQAWFLNLVVLGLITTTVVYALKGAIAPQKNWKNILTGKVKGHMSLLLSAIALLIALGFWLQRYELLYSPEGVVFGAGYTDVHARLSAYWTMTFVTLALAGLFLMALWQRGFALPIYGLGLYLVVFVLVSGVYPWFQQSFIVEPNELEKERPYVANNIEFTRNAYGLQQVQRQRYPARNHLDQQSLQDNQGTIRNIRLWDYRRMALT